MQQLLALVRGPDMDSTTETPGCFRQLRAWQAACDLAEAVYRACAAFPDDEKYGITSQLRRAAVSVPSNIAEGSGRSGRREYARFVGIAAGSLAEVRSLLELAKRLGYLSREGQDALDARADQVARMLHGLIRALRERETGGGCPS